MCSASIWYCGLPATLPALAAGTGDAGPLQGPGGVPAGQAAEDQGVGQAPARPVMAPCPSPEPGVRMAFVADPEGNLVELLHTGAA